MTKTSDIRVNYQKEGSGSKFRDPLHSYYAEFMPQNLDELMAFNEIVYHSSTDVKSSLQKFIRYIASNLKIEFKETPSDNEAMEDLKKKITKDLGLLAFIQNVGEDYYIGGNVGTLILPPRNKFFKCDSCGHKFKFSSVTKSVAGVDPNSSRLLYKITDTCPHCEALLGHLPAIEETDVNAESLNLINWPVSYIAVEKSPFSNNAVYYLDFPQVFEKEYMSKSQVFLNDTPENLLHAIHLKKKFQMNPAYFNFLKAKPISSSFGKFGMPPLTDAIFRFIHAEILKRGNEAISLDHTIPLDIIHPNLPNSGGIGGGIVAMDLHNHKAKIKEIIDNHRKDATRVNFLPFPIGIQQLKNSGRALNLQGDIEAAEMKIADSFGVPREFFAGTLNITAAPLALKLLENQMREIYDALNNLLSKILKVMHASDIRLFKNIKSISLEEFKTADNVEYSASLRELYLSGKVSNKTYGAHVGINLQEESKLMRQELRESMKESIATSRDEENVTMSFGEQAKQIVESGGMGGVINPHHPDNVTMQAEQIAQELVLGDPNQAKSYLAQLKGQDYVMYSVVRTRYQELKYQNDKEGDML